MQTVIRYTVVNQDGKPVIRAMPVLRSTENRVVQRVEPSSDGRELGIIRKIRRLRMLDFL